MADASTQPGSSERSLTGVRRATGYERYGKRMLDLVLALASLPVAVPLIAGAWACARLDGGPGFFTQERVGKGGRVFYCRKLRTMRVDAEKVLKALYESDPGLAAEWDRNQKLADDPRVTRIGRFLRRSSLDELPQIWNVLRGDMSLVGPRPFMVDQAEAYRDGGGVAYFELRPGLTGPWQIDGRGITAFIDRIQYDNSYYQNLSLVRDIRYLVRTVRVVLTSTGA